MSQQRRLHHAVRHAAHHARTTLAADETGNVATVQMQMNDLQMLEAVPVLGQFGFQSSLPVGTDVLRVSFNGQLSSGAAVASNHIPSRAKGLPPGASRMHDANGVSVSIGMDGLIRAMAPGEVLHRLVTDLFMQLFNTHTHPANGAPPAQQMTAAHLTTALRGGS